VTENQPAATRFTAPDGEVFRVLAWPGDRDLPALLVQHGLGEHGGRYQALADGLAGRARVLAFDARGHGHSAGVLGDAAGIDQLADDLQQVVAHVREAYAIDRLVVYGHSMGGSVTARMLTRRTPVDGVAAVVLSAPAVAVSGTLAMKVKVKVGKVLKRVAPEMVIGNSLPLSGISSDPAEVTRYVDDPLVHDRVSLRLGDSIISLGPSIRAAADVAAVPALMVHGDDDPIIPVEGTRELYERWGHPLKRLVVLAGGRHEVHHEVPAVRQQLFHHVASFLDDALAEAG